MDSGGGVRLLKLIRPSRRQISMDSRKSILIDAATFHGTVLTYLRSVKSRRNPMCWANKHGTHLGLQWMYEVYVLRTSLPTGDTAEVTNFTASSRFSLGLISVTVEF